MGRGAREKSEFLGSGSRQLNQMMTGSFYDDSQTIMRQCNGNGGALNPFFYCPFFFPSQLVVRE